MKECVVFHPHAIRPSLNFAASHPVLQDPSLLRLVIVVVMVVVEEGVVNLKFPLLLEVQQSHSCSNTAMFEFKLIRTI